MWSVHATLVADRLISVMFVDPFCLELGRGANGSTVEVEVSLIPVCVNALSTIVSLAKRLSDRMPEHELPDSLGEWLALAVVLTETGNPSIILYAVYGVD